MKYVLGIDVGTSGTKAVLYDKLCNVIDSSTVNYDMYQPNNGWAEQNPNDWQSATFSTILNLTNKHRNKKVVGIGLSGQMHGLVLLDIDNKPLMNSIIWCDTRADKECNQIIDILPNYAEYTLNPPIVGFTLPKLLWIKNNLPQIYSRINKVILPKDYVNYCLTGNFATDVSDASGTGYFDVANRCWSQEVISAFGIKEEWLPKVYSSQDVIGVVDNAIADRLGLNINVTVVAGAGDQAAAGLGNRIIHDGDCSISLGSSGVVFVATERPIQDKLGRVHTFCHAVPNMWHIMGVTQGAGLSLKWYKQNFAVDLDYKALDECSDKLPIGSNGLIYLPYLMGERTPHLNSFIRGAFIGLSANSNTNDMYRAVLEGVSFSLKDCYIIIKEMCCIYNKIVVSGGGAKSPLWLQILADILGVDMRTSNNIESGTRGVAMLALVGCGVYSDVVSTIESHYYEQGVLINANKDNSDKYTRIYPLFQELYQLLAENNKKLLQLNVEEK